MPTYLGQPVSDDYLQGLIRAYRAGQKAGGGAEEESDQVIINDLEANRVQTEMPVSAYELGQSRSGA